MNEAVEQKYLDVLKCICDLKRQARLRVELSKTGKTKVAGQQAEYRKVASEMDVAWEVLCSGKAPAINAMLKQAADKQEELLLEMLDRRVIEYRDAGMDVVAALTSDVNYAQQRIIYARQILGG